MQIDLPEAVDMVPVDVVDAIARAIQQEHDAVLIELARVNEEAETIRRVLEGTSGRDIGAGDEAERRLLTFLDEWARRDEAELDAAVDAARARADERVRLAHVEAAAVLGRLEAEAAHAPSSGPVPAPPVVDIVPPAGLTRRVPSTGPVPVGPAAAQAVVPPAALARVEVPVSPFAPAPEGEAVPLVEAPSAAPEVARAPLDELLETVLAALEGGQPAAQVLDLLPEPAGPVPIPAVVSAPAAEPSPDPVAEPTAGEATPEAIEPARADRGRPLHHLLPMVALVALLALCLVLFV